MRFNIDNESFQELLARNNENNLSRFGNLYSRIGIEFFNLNILKYQDYSFGGMKRFDIDEYNKREAIVTYAKTLC